jgi:formamidopyrimidine-DNA glycosylase
VPELPEVETIRRQLAPVVEGRQIVDAWAFPSTKFTPAVEATGATIVTIGRRGKYLVAALDDDRELIVHLGMTGRLQVSPPAETTPADDDPYVRAWWQLDDGSFLVLRDVRRFGRVAVVPAGDYDDLPTLAHLGPEPFSDAFTPQSLYAAVAASSSHLKTQLINQRAVAGVGNIYADEALWRARINPATTRLSLARATALHAAVRGALADAIGNDGTTFRDYRAANGEPGRNQRHLDCYGRAGLPCNRCGTELRRRVLEGRSTTWCPHCQRR